VSCRLSITILAANEDAEEKEALKAKIAELTIDHSKIDLIEE
jgi:hypothetical protein